MPQVHQNYADKSKVHKVHRNARKGRQDRKRACLNNDQLLDLVPLASIHPGPRSVCQRAADSPHNGYGGFESTYERVSIVFSVDRDIASAASGSLVCWREWIRTWLLNLASHLDDAGCAACRRRGVVADEGARSAVGDAGEHCDVCGVVEVVLCSWY